jgi:hypothetical protein
LLCRKMPKTVSYKPSIHSQCPTPFEPNRKA